MVVVGAVMVKAVADMVAAYTRQAEAIDRNVAPAPAAPGA
jgi:hypothetical protein